MAWLAGCRRLHRRYERKAAHFLAFAGIAATLICYRTLAASGRCQGCDDPRRNRMPPQDLGPPLRAETCAYPIEVAHD